MAQQQEFVDFEIETNLEEVAAWGGESRPLVPPGDYVLTATHVEQKPSKAKGTPMIAVTFEVQDEGEHKGAKVFNNYPLTQDAMGRIKSLIVACGGSLNVIRASEILGQTIRAQVVHSQSAGGVDSNGNPLEPKTFANVQNEMPYEEVKAATATKTTTPPISRATSPSKATPNGARRA